MTNTLSPRRRVSPSVTNHNQPTRRSQRPSRQPSFLFPLPCSALASHFALVLPSIPSPFLPRKPNPQPGASSQRRNGPQAKAGPPAEVGRPPRRARVQGRGLGAPRRGGASQPPRPSSSRGVVHREPRRSTRRGEERPHGTGPQRPQKPRRGARRAPLQLAIGEGSALHGAPRARRGGRRQRRRRARPRRGRRPRQLLCAARRLPGECRRRSRSRPRRGRRHQPGRTPQAWRDGKLPREHRPQQPPGTPRRRRRVSKNRHARREDGER